MTPDEHAHSPEQGRLDRPPLPGAYLDLPASFGRRFAIFVDTEEEFDWSQPTSRDRHGTSAAESLPKVHFRMREAGVKPVYCRLADRDGHTPACRPCQSSSARRMRGRHAPSSLAQSAARGRAQPRQQLCRNLPEALERAKLLRLTEAIENNIGKRPIGLSRRPYGSGRTPRGSWPRRVTRRIIGAAASTITATKAAPIYRVRAAPLSCRFAGRASDDRRLYRRPAPPGRRSTTGRRIPRGAESLRARACSTGSPTRGGRSAARGDGPVEHSSTTAFASSAFPFIADNRARPYALRQGPDGSRHVLPWWDGMFDLFARRASRRPRSRTSSPPPAPLPERAWRSPRAFAIPGRGL